MSLAVSESKRRKEMRAAGQSQSAQAQPKVVDQAITDMAPQQMPAMPEQQGIGSLPAAAQMNFADGGITGYADGGEVERYQVGGPLNPSEAPYDRMNRINRGIAAEAEAESRAKAADREAQAAAIGVLPYGEQMSRMGSAFGNIPGEVLRTLVSAPGYGLSNLFGASAQKQAASPAAGAPADQAQYNPSEATRRSMYEQAQTPSAEPGKAPLVGAAPRAPSAQAPAAPAQEGLEALQKRMLSGVDAERKGLLSQRQEIAEGLKSLKEKNLGEFEAETARRGDVYKGREERQSAREKELGGMEDKNMGLALLQAGAAMMSTPGGIGAAIGKGVAVGSERYASGMDKINTAKDKFAEAKEKLDDLRINREDMSSSERRKLKGEISSAEQDGKKFLYEGAVSDLGVKRGDVENLFKTIAAENLHKLDAASREKIAAMQESGAQARSKAQIEASLNTPERQAFQGYLSKTVTKEKPLGDPAAAYEAMVAAKREPVTEEKLRESWFDPIKRSQIAKDYPGVKTFEDYMSAVNSTGTKSPATGKVPAPPSGFKLN